jgi:hypothetical protein
MAEYIQDSGIKSLLLSSSELTQNHSDGAKYLFHLI